MSQKNFQIFRSQISDLISVNLDYLKKPPWKIFFFDIFVIHLSSRYEKQCRMLQRLFSLFQGSKNQLCFFRLVSMKAAQNFFEGRTRFVTDWAQKTSHTKLVTKRAVLKQSLPNSHHNLFPSKPTPASVASVGAALCLKIHFFLRDAILRQLKIVLRPDNFCNRSGTKNSPC